MKSTYGHLAFAGLLLICGCSESNSKSHETNVDWQEMERIREAIHLPTIPDRTLIITEFGAKGDGSTDCLPAIKEAIARASAEGGGKITIPAGEYLVNGPITLSSGIELHLDAGAIVRFSTRPDDYLPVVLTRWEGVECYNYSPLIYALGQEDVAITGEGVLDGQSDTTNWWPWSGARQYGWHEGLPSQADSLSRPRLYDWNTRSVPVEDRILGEGAFLRPNFIQFHSCKRVLIEGVTIRNSPMWVMHPVMSDQVTVRSVRVQSHGPNSDGCDPESCSNVLIEDCYFDTGDDCIALKSGRNQDGRRISRPVENVVIRKCQMKDGHGGVVIGSEVSGGARNIFAEDCEMNSPNLERALRIKTNKVRGGTVENLFFRNISIGIVKEAVLRVNLHYPVFSDPNQEYIPVVQNIFLENIQSGGSEYGLLIEGYDEAHPVQNVHLKGCSFSGVREGNKIEFATNLHSEECFINGSPLTVNQ